MRSTAKLLDLVANCELRSAFKSTKVKAVQSLGVTSTIQSLARTLTQTYPRPAVAAVLTRREEAIPALLQVLKLVPFEWAKGEWNPDWIIHEFALYVLSEFGEPRAFPLILEIARLPALDDLLGDGVTESLPKRLAATFSGELNVFYPLIEDQAADEFARGTALCAIGVIFK